jgi:hypothetical protein
MSSTRRSLIHATAATALATRFAESSPVDSAQIGVVVMPYLAPLIFSNGGPQLPPLGTVILSFSFATNPITVFYMKTAGGDIYMPFDQIAGLSYLNQREAMITFIMTSLNDQFAPFGLTVQRDQVLIILPALPTM